MAPPTRTPRNRWIEEGLSALAASGPDAVRIESLAQALGVTKGGFYWHFKDRRDLLDALLRSWSRGRIAAIEQQADAKQSRLDDATARARLKSLIRLYSQHVNRQGLAIELAIRQWAHGDPAAAQAVARVDAARLANVARLYGALGLAPRDAEARAFLFYAFIFGQSLLGLGRGPRQRGRLVAVCTDVLTMP